MSICSTGLGDGAKGWRILDPKWDGKSTFSPREIAAIFEVTPWCIYEEIKKGKIPAVDVGRLKRIPRAWVEQKLAAVA
jgi:excisionase family DNA binding protein